MKGRILLLLRSVEPGQIVRRQDVAAVLDTTEDANGGAFRREWDVAVKEAASEGILLVSMRSGGRYERKVGEDGARAALDRSRALTRKALRGIAHGQRLVVAAPLLTQDEHMRAALERQADRAELMLATVGHLRRQRRF